MGFIHCKTWLLALVKRVIALSWLGAGAGMARARAAKEMREKRAILERESMAVELEQESKLRRKRWKERKLVGPEMKNLLCLIGQHGKQNDYFQQVFLESMNERDTITLDIFKSGIWFAAFGHGAELGACWPAVNTASGDI
jgi:hypothetical protein